MDEAVNRAGAPARSVEDRVTDHRPALAFLLGESFPGYGPHDECAGCPMGTPDPAADYEPNPYDPGEGYYACVLLGRGMIWGESPACEPADWKRRARAEIAGTAPPVPGHDGRRL